MSENSREAAREAAMRSSREASTAREEQRKRIDEAILAALDRADLSSDDLLRLTIARRLNHLSDSTFAQALGEIEQKPPLNFWGKR
jgi:hypothetical protein